MTALIVVLVLIVVLAIPLTIWIKREGERSFARHQEMVRQARQREAMVRLSITIRDNLTPAFRRMAAELAAMGEALSKAAEALKAVER